MRPLPTVGLFAAALSTQPVAAQLGDAVPDFVMLADAEGDGVVSQDEFVAYYALIWELAAPGKPRVDLAAAHPLLRGAIDGIVERKPSAIGRDEYLDAAAAHHREADGDGDGQVSMAEMRAWKNTAMALPPADKPKG